VARPALDDGAIRGTLEYGEFDAHAASEES
jgi:hypothetical protein